MKSLAKTAADEDRNNKPSPFQANKSAEVNENMLAKNSDADGSFFQSRKTVFGRD